MSSGPEPGARLDDATQSEVVSLLAARSAVPVPAVTTTGLESDDDVVRRVGGRRPDGEVPYTVGGWLLDAAATDRTALQDDTVWAVAGVHLVDLTGVELTRFGFDPDGPSALRQHVDRWRATYERLAGSRPVLDDAFAWIDARWPAHDGGHARLVWGDAHVGNVVYHGFRPAALLAWRYAGIAPAGVDLGSMALRHLLAQRSAEERGAAGLPGFCDFDELCETYEARTAVTVGDHEFWLVYAALRHAVATADAASTDFLRTAVGSMM